MNKRRVMTVENILPGVMIAVGAGMVGHFWGSWWQPLGVFLLIVGLDAQYEQRNKK